MSSQPAADLACVRLFVLDVDGTLTDGRVVYDSEGREIQRFHVHDGYGLARLRQLGVRVVWITGRGSGATEKRARELGVDELHQGVESKGAVLLELQERLGLGPEQTAAMGDDLPDLELRARAGFFAAPADARPEVRAAADRVTASAGGCGAVREVCECILRAAGAHPA